MPSDSARLRADLLACFPSLVIDSVAKESGQRVVYFAHFDDALIPSDVLPESEFLHDWCKWGRVVVKVVSDAGVKFRRITVPTRFIDQMYGNYIDRQKAFCVDAFMDLISPEEEVCISLAVTSSMIEDETFRTKLLTWITSYPNVVELYLIYSAPRDTKQIRDRKFLVACHRLGQEMSGIGLDLTWGHQNTEAMLSTAQGDIGVTMGSFENTRIFSIDKFLVTTEDRRGPKARIYLPGLLNWVQFDQAKEIRSQMPKVWEERPEMAARSANEATARDAGIDSNGAKRGLIFARASTSRGFSLSWSYRRTSGLPKPPSYSTMHLYRFLLVLFRNSTKLKTS
ncbi:hypothetical protein [Polaromonas sp.]|uniref:hypothetical protein n=1 Tax=Polaromonas sp. TaxID=1869339 RepID=UPI003C97ABB3